MGEYLDVDGMKMWFDSWGSGSPLVLLHGGFGSNAHSEPQAPALAEHFGVVAPERRGHGHTPDVKGPITYELMTQDTIGSLETVVGGPAHLVAGAMVGMSR